MIEKDKNKSRLKTTPVVEQTRLPDGQGSLRGKKSKILVLGLVLIILIGILSPVLSPTKISRAADDDLGTCYFDGVPSENIKEKNCPNPKLNFVPYSEKNPPPPPPKEESPLEKAAKNACGIIVKGSLGGCLVTLFYYLFFTLTSFLLVVAARFFDIVVALTLNSRIYGPFINDVWVIVRDLSNIFFILILLYIAIKIILDIGGSEAKKMIAKVIIVALLINFSMFFTKVIIDSSNILALIFYNKMDIEAKDKETGEILDRNHIPAVAGDKGLSAALVSHFNPSKLLSTEFFKNLETKGAEFSKAGFAGYVGAGALLGNFIPIPGIGAGVGALAGAVGYFLSSGKEVPVPLLLGIIFVTGAIMAFAAYALFIAGITFISRIIELWILIIFSPFAFMSSTIPLLEKIDYIGWDSWIKRLLKVSFLAPIFLFLLYLIFQIIKADPIGSLAIRTPENQGWMETILFLAIPALIILILLMKATKFAKEGSGALGEALIKGAKVVAGVGLGVAGGLAIGGAAKGLQATVGKYSEKLAESETAKRLVKRGVFGADSLQRGAKFLGGRDFDARKGAVGGLLKSAEGVTGLKFGSASKFLLKEGGGYRGDRERAEKKRQERVNKLKVSEDEPLKQELNTKEEELQEMKNDTSHEIGQIDIRRETTRKTTEDRRQVRDATRSESEIKKDKLENIANNTTQEQDYNMAKAAFDTASGTLDSNTRNTTQEQDYNMAKAALDALIASGTAVTDPAYIAAEAAKNTAATAVGATNPAYVAAKDAYDAAEAAKNTAATAVGATNPAYVAAKDAYDESIKNYEKANDEFQESATLLRNLTNHRSKIKNAKAIVDTSGEIDMAANETEFNTAQTELAAAEGLLATAKIDEAKAKASLKAAIGTIGEASAKLAYDAAKADLDAKTEDEGRKRGRKELATAALASARFGKGQSINNYEDDILPKAREAIENENRERLISYAKRNVRGSDVGVINALRTMVTTAGDDQASRNAAAHKIIMEVKIENNK